ncbi:MAG TPA: DinB family protein [Mycobacteriales bacterium]|nr:DinB family protein [Mycobacteriales bacterium]
MWTAPPVDRPDEPFAADERAMLQGFLEVGRATLLHKCAGLTGAQLAERTVPPSTLSLLGLVRHVTDVERSWFRRRFAAEPIERRYEDAFAAEPDNAERDYARLLAEQEACRRAVAPLSLDHVFRSERWGPMQLRWGYCHLIGEYDRHNGHADLLRECLDGTTGG